MLIADCAEIYVTGIFMNYVDEHRVLMNRLEVHTEIVNAVKKKMFSW